MAERAGFEPAVHLSAYTRLAGEHLRPTRSSLRDYIYIRARFTELNADYNPEIQQAE